MKILFSLVIIFCCVLSSFAASSKMDFWSQQRRGANQAGLKVVLTMLSLPGDRWKQHNSNVEERKIWQDFAQQEIALSFWKLLASALKNHPAIVGYNIRNEPSPEFVEPRLTDWYMEDRSAWYAKVRNTPADLNLFYRKTVAAIREVDKKTPIVLDSGFYATAWGFKVLEPVADEKTLYSFHMYEPYFFNSQFDKGLQNLRRFCLATKDAHGLYAQYGFEVTQKPNYWMEIKDNDLYKKLAMRTDKPNPSVPKGDVK